MSDLRDAALKSKAWPFEEARKLVKRFAGAPPEKGYALFETGYGPSMPAPIERAGPSSTCTTAR